MAPCLSTSRQTCTACISTRLVRFAFRHRPLRASILCASDHIPLERLRAALAADDIAVVHASNGRAAWTLLLQDPPVDLLIVECALQGINGFELCRLIRADARLHRLPLVMVCASERLPSALEGVVDRYLSAPVETDDLSRVVQGLLRRTW